MISRQNLYKTYLHCDEEKLQRDDNIRDQIISILEGRRGLSGTQVRKELLTRGVRVGRDKFYQIVNRYKLTLNSRKKAWKRQHYRSKAASNMILNHTFRRVFEVLFADYTEISTNEGKVLLLLVEDLVSRYITAYRVSNTCKSAPVVEALQESLALKASLKLRYKTIFHTDRGSEFVNHAVKTLAASNNVVISNTGKNHCYENAYMESLNKTLKYCLGLRDKFNTKEEAYQNIEAAINSYNYEHLHNSIGKRVPRTVLMSYTGKKSGKPEGNRGSCPSPGRGARTYSKSLVVKIKKIGLDR
ncbi:MAG: IS3 family transposase [Candidatus Cloacimonadaceae bacterium]